MKRRAFTLIELLVVVAIMGLLGTASVGGYRQMQRGMEERGVMQNVNEFLRNAYQRAQIDRVPVEIYFWNETTRSRSDDENELVHGRAVAVRRQGRVTMIGTGPSGGKLLIDEFADMQYMDSDGDGYAEAPDRDSTIRLYQMNANDSSKRYSQVYSVMRSSSKNPESGGFLLDCVNHDPMTDNNIVLQYGQKGRLILFGYEIAEQGTAQWSNSAAYGMEFLSLELPNGYLVDSNYSQKTDDPVKGERKLVYKPEGSAEVITVYSIRPGNGGQLQALKVATADNPTQKR